MGADAITEHSLPSLHTRTTLMPPRSLFSQFRPFLFGNRTLLHSFFFQRLLIPFRLIFEWSLSFPFLAKFRGEKCLCDQTIGLSWFGTNRLQRRRTWIPATPTPGIVPCLTDRVKFHPRVDLRRPKKSRLIRHVSGLLQSEQIDCDLMDGLP